MNWHKRYQQQAGWTKTVREYLWEKAGLDSAQRALELGCGTGAILETLPSPPGHYGLDLSLSALRQAQIHAPGARLTQGAGEFLPFPAATFDLVFCHFLLLWTLDPVTILREMARVARPGGSLLALAEPDYEARIDEPPALAELGRWQTQSLLAQGINPRMGRQLAGVFAEAGITLIESGIHAAAWGASASTQAEEEWAVIEADLAGKIFSSDLQRQKVLETQARQSLRRVLFVPTFYAWGAV